MKLLLLYPIFVHMAMCEFGMLRCCGLYISLLTDRNLVTTYANSLRDGKYTCIQTGDCAVFQRKMIKDAGTSPANRPNRQLFSIDRADVQIPTCG